MKTPGKIYIGTSNVVVPGNKASFPESFRSGSRLHYYGHIFNSVELNSCFYKTPLRSTCEKWATEVPSSFRFSMKLSKAVTHAKDLKYEQGSIEKFMYSVEGIGEKKACLLIQFPGKIGLDHFEKVEKILHELEEYDPGRHWNKAVEFRNPGWHVGETYELLDEFNAAMVLHDIPKARMMEARGKAPIIYIRFHGPKGDYRGSYEDEYLRSMAEKAKDWLKKGKDVYAYFNNTMGSAFENAKTLKKLISP